MLTCNDFPRHWAACNHTEQTQNESTVLARCALRPPLREIPRNEAAAARPRPLCPRGLLAPSGPQVAGRIRAAQASAGRRALPGTGESLEDANWPLLILLMSD
ncbi:hypothetical protein MRX96_041379 [Rhipicephalus microplus]